MSAAPRAASATAIAPRSLPRWLDVETVALALVTTAVALAAAGLLPWEVGALEAAATVSGAGSVWLLARNNIWGWWVGLISVACFGVLFYTVALYADMTLQGFYVVTSLYAIHLWRRGGSGPSNGADRPVANLRMGHWIWIVPMFFAAWWALTHTLIWAGGALPAWDALTALGSVAAQLLLMLRYVQAWWFWVAVDVIYIPLYLERGLTLTAMLYAGFLVMAVAGLVRFRRLARPEAPHG